MTNFTFSCAVADYMNGSNQTFMNIWAIHKINQGRMADGIPSIFATGPSEDNCGPMARVDFPLHQSDY